MKNKVLYVAAAGSGGHILPALTLAKRWLEKTPNGKVVFWGSNKSIDQKVISNSTCFSEFIGVNITGFSFKRPWLLPSLLFWLVYAFFKASFKSIKQKPEKIICTGGLISLPICLACRLTGTMVEVYELNAVPGKATKFLMPISNTIYTAFEETKKDCNWGKINFEKKCRLTQYPIRFSSQNLMQVDRNKIIENINQKYFPTKPFSPDRKTVFILGGSQGSVSLNKIIKKFLHSNVELSDKIQLIHQIGGSTNKPETHEYLEFPAVVFSYNENIENFYNLADLIICRAGAGTIFEVEFFSKPCIVVPLVTSTTSHQINNANAMAQKHPGLFTVLDQKLLETNCKFLHHHVLSDNSYN